MLRANYRKYQGGWAWLSWAIPAAISAAKGIMGKQAADDQQALNSEQLALQRDALTNSIQWRVEDARNAGVSPLYALGATPQTPAPISTHVDNSMMSDALSEMGQSLSKGFAQETKEQRAIRMAQLAELESRTRENDARAALALSQAARLRQADQSSSAFGNDVVVGAYKDSGPLTSHPLYADAVRLEPDQMVSRDRVHVGQTAGREHPSMREFVMPNGDKVLLPATGQGGIPEEIDFTMIPEIIGANIKRYGGMQTVLGALFRWFGYSLPELQRKGEAIRQEYNRTGRMPGDLKR